MGGVRRIGAAAMVLALLGGVGACGGDDGDEDAAEPTTTEGSDDETTTTEESDDSGSDSGSNGVFGNLEDCVEFATAFGSLSLAFLGGTAGGEDFDPEQVIDQMDAVAEDAPDAVQDAIELVVETYQQVFDNFQDAELSFDDATDLASQEFAEAIEPLNDADFNEASTVVSDYVAEECDQSS
jgi:hypothetical protein